MARPNNHRFNKLHPLRLAGLVFLLLLGGCRYEEVEIEIGFLGEARRNPFLAAQRLCEEFGLEAETLLSLKDMPHHHTTLILSADAIKSKGMSDLVSTWVSEGGTLIYLLEGATRFRNEFDEDFAFEDVDEEREDLILEEFEVRLGESGDWGIRNLEFEGNTFLMDFPDDSVFEANWVSDDEDYFGHRGPVFEFNWGDGLVYLVSDAHPFRNKQIGDNDHAAFFWSLIDGADNYYVTFVLGAKISFFGLLWSRGWMVLVPILIMIAIWIWKNVPRHGPTLPERDPSERDFAAHVDTLGQFLWRHRAGGRLLDSVRQRIRSAVKFQTPYGDTDSMNHLLAEKSGLPVDRVLIALTVDPGKDPARFVQITRDLHTLEKSL